MALYTGTVWWAPKDKLLSLVTVKNQHLLTEILETGQGVVLIAPHMVGLELGGIFLSLRFDGISIYQYSHNPVFDRAMLKARQRFGAKLFERKSNLRHLIRAIQQGKPCLLATQAIEFIEAHADEQPDLKRVGDALGLSTSAMNRLFSCWVGISPKRFLQSLTLDRSQRNLRAGLSTTSSALESEGALDAAQRANSTWKKMLDEYEAPPIDEGLDEALREFVMTKKNAVPDSNI